MDLTWEDREANESSRSVTEYFLMKLKRVDDEMHMTNAELREVMEEIRTKDSRINLLRKKLQDLLSEESKKKIKKLEREKAALNKQMSRANEILGRMGLTWVGDSGKNDPKACCTSSNENYKGIIRTPVWPGPEASHQGHSRINSPRNPVIPFSGVGYRLGTGSEIFGYSQSNQEITNRSKRPFSSEKTDGLMRRQSRAQQAKDVQNKPTSTGDKLQSTKYKTDDGIDKIVEDQKLEPQRAKSYEDLPVEFLRMTTLERLRALKQMSVQTQKNMNKYYH